MSLIWIFVVLSGLAALPGFHRLLAGPTDADRVVGLDLLFAVGIIQSLLAAVASGRTVYVDVAIGLAVVGLVATLAWARLIQARSGSGGEESP
jgi:multicomponent Na+:H+ antiporter subunit F